MRPFSKNAPRARSTSRLIVTLVAAIGLLPVFAAPAGAGFGGSVATTSTTYRFIGTTGQYGTSTYDVEWYTPSNGTCTHTYPNNDTYRNNIAGGFNIFTWDDGTSGSNCNRAVLYRDGVQGGGGAYNCLRTASWCYTGYTYYSISWHNG